MNKINPLIAESDQETIENASEALSALMALMAHSHSDLCRLMLPIQHAIDHVVEKKNS